MNGRLAELVRCPASGKPLELIGFARRGGEPVPGEVETGVLVAEDGRWYPVIEGVPRLLEGASWMFPDFRREHEQSLRDHDLIETIEKPDRDFRERILPTLRAFEREWLEHDLRGRTWRMDQGTRRENVMFYLDLKTTEEAAGQLILDAGAGTGQLSATLGELGCEVVAVDLAPTIVRGRMLAREKGLLAHVHFVQANLLRPPFQASSFDAVHCSGVLHHMPDTRAGFDALAPLVRPGGRYFVHLYHDAVRYPIPLVPFSRSRFTTIDAQLLRRFTPRLPPRLLYSLVWIHAALFHLCYKVNQAVRGVRHDQSIRERATSLFDSLAPPFQWKHTPEEVRGWFRDQGFEQVKDTSTPDVVAGGFNLTGVRGR